MKGVDANKLLDEDVHYWVHAGHRGGCLFRNVAPPREGEGEVGRKERGVGLVFKALSLKESRTMLDEQISREALLLIMNLAPAKKAT